MDLLFANTTQPEKRGPGSKSEKDFANEKF
jgi:hypothetical protein